MFLSPPPPSYLISLRPERLKYRSNDDLANPLGKVVIFICNVLWKINDLYKLIAQQFIANALNYSDSFKRFLRIRKIILYKQNLVYTTITVVIIARHNVQIIVYKNHRTKLLQLL